MSCTCDWFTGIKVTWIWRKLWIHSSVCGVCGCVCALMHFVTVIYPNSSYLCVCPFRATFPHSLVASQLWCRRVLLCFLLSDDCAFELPSIISKVAIIIKNKWQRVYYYIINAFITCSWNWLCDELIWCTVIISNNYSKSNLNFISRKLS